jgi:hypothetical protein
MISLRHFEQALARLIPIFAPLIILSRNIGAIEQLLPPMTPMAPMVFASKQRLESSRAQAGLRASPRSHAHFLLLARGVLGRREHRGLEELDASAAGPSAQPRHRRHRVFVGSPPWPNSRVDAPVTCSRVSRSFEATRSAARARLAYVTKAFSRGRKSHGPIFRRTFAG